MITIKTKRNGKRKGWNRSEVNILIEFLYQILENIEPESGTIDCRNCEYKNLCYDVKTAIRYLENNR